MSVPSPEHVAVAGEGGHGCCADSLCEPDCRRSTDSIRPSVRAAVRERALSSLCPPQAGRRHAVPDVHEVVPEVVPVEVRNDERRRRAAAVHDEDRLQAVPRSVLLGNGDAELEDTRTSAQVVVPVILSREDGEGSRHGRRFRILTILRRASPTQDDESCRGSLKGCRSGVHGRADHDRRHAGGRPGGQAVRVSSRSAEFEHLRCLARRRFSPTLVSATGRLRRCCFSSGTSIRNYVPARAARAISSGEAAAPRLRFPPRSPGTLLRGAASRGRAYRAIR